MSLARPRAFRVPSGGALHRARCGGQVHWVAIGADRSLCGLLAREDAESVPPFIAPRRGLCPRCVEAVRPDVAARLVEARRPRRAAPRRPM